MLVCNNTLVCHSCMSYTHIVYMQVEGRVVVDMTTASTAIAVDAPVGLTEGVVEEGKRAEASLLKKMDGILNDYAGNGGGTVTMGGAPEKK